jgi:hypothetical protein
VLNSKSSSQQSNSTAHSGGSNASKKTSSKLNSSSDNSTSSADSHNKDLKKQNNNSSAGAPHIEDYMDGQLNRPPRSNVNDYDSEEHMANEANKSYHKANGIAPSTAAGSVSSLSSRKLNKDSAQNNASNNASSTSSKRGKANNTTHHISFTNNKDDTITRYVYLVVHTAIH